jgi:hypothetical protein
MKRCSGLLPVTQSPLYCIRILQYRMSLMQPITYRE